MHATKPSQSQVLCFLCWGLRLQGSQCSSVTKLDTPTDHWTDQYESGSAFGEFEALTGFAGGLIKFTGCNETGFF